MNVSCEIKFFLEDIIFDVAHDVSRKRWTVWPKFLQALIASGKSALPPALGWVWEQPALGKRVAASVGPSLPFIFLP